MKTIPLTRGYTAIVDDADFELLSRYKWRATVITPRNKVIYARGSVRQNVRQNKSFFMHRKIVGATKGQLVDHINRNGLDNRRCNLRFVTDSQNKYNCGKTKSNTSGFKGVVWHRKARKWQAQINVDKRTKYLGLFSNMSDAVAAYAEVYQSL